jgi:signal peptidase I
MKTAKPGLPARLARWRRRQAPLAGLFTDLLLVIVLLVLCRSLAVQGSYVLSDSMEPTLLPGDWLLTDTLIYHLRAPRHGEIVVFPAPLEPGLDYVKRLIALPGDRVKLIGDRVVLDGELLEEPYLSAELRAVDPAPESINAAEELVVPPGECLVLGDNRPHSKDSRSWGLLPLEDVFGRVELVYFSYAPGTEGDGVRWWRTAVPPDGASPR